MDVISLSKRYFLYKYLAILKSTKAYVRSDHAFVNFNHLGGFRTPEWTEAANEKYGGRLSEAIVVNGQQLNN